MQSPVTKRFVSAQELNNLSFVLADKIFRAGIRPTWVIALWRGGTPVGLCVQEYLAYCGIKTDHIAIRTGAYKGIGKQHDTVRVYSTEYIVKNANATDTLLIVDDMFDTGKTMQKVVDVLEDKMRMNVPAKIYIATVFYKPQNNVSDLYPNFYCEETTDWIVFDHELEELTIEEISKYKPVVAALLAEKQPETSNVVCSDNQDATEMMKFQLFPKNHQPSWFL